jgi:hypothetical protein
MGIKRKILLGFFIIIFLLLASLCGIGLYYYHKPAAAKALIENSIAQYTHSSFRIEKLFYSLNPLKISAEGILFEPGKDHRGFYLEIPEITADMALEGTFGNKSLTLKTLKVDGFSCRVSHDMVLPKIESKSKRPSFLGKMLKRALGLLLFRDIQFEAAQITKGLMVAETGKQMVRISNIHAYLNEEHLLEISCEGLFKWPLRKMQFIAPNLSLTTDRAISLVDPDVSCLLKTTDSVFQSPEVKVKGLGVNAKIVFNREKMSLTMSPLELNLEGISLEQFGVDAEAIEVKAKLIYDQTRKKMVFEPLSFFTEGVALKKTDSLPMDVSLKTRGSFDLAKALLEVSDFDLSVSDFAGFKGTMSAGIGDEMSFRLELSDGRFLPEKALPLAPLEIRSQLKPVIFAGPLFFLGAINGMRQKNEWNLSCDLHARLRKNRFTYAAGETEVSSSISADARVQGDIPEVQITADVNCDETVFSGKTAVIKPSKIGLSFSGTYPDFAIEALKANVPGATVKTGSRDILIDDIEVRIPQGTLNAKKRSIHFPEILLESSLLKNLVLAVRVEGERLAFALQGRKTNLMETARVLNVFPPGWQGNGIDSIQIRAFQEGKENWSFISEIGLQGLEFENRDSSCAGEKISLNAKIAGKVNLGKPLLSAKASLEVNEGEALYDRFYMDFKSNAVFCSCDAAYDLSEKHLNLSDLQFGIKDMLSLNIKGDIFQEKRFDLALSIPEISLKPVFDNFVLEPFQTEKPFLNTLEIGGDFSANLKLTGIGMNWTALGNLVWHEGEISSQDKSFFLEGINLDFPVWYQSQEGLKVTKKAHGNLSVQSINLPILPEQSLTIKIDAGPNALSTKSPMVIKIPGGNVSIGPIVSKDIFGKQPSINTSLSMNEVAINPLLSGLWQEPVKGRINGKLNSIKFKGGNLTSSGNIRADVFGGEIILSKFGASGLFSPAPVFRISSRMRSLRLAEMTRGTPFGKIEGVLDGYVKDIEVAYGQPQKFDLLLETIPTKGVSQRISIKAVDNIARIGGGQSPFVGIAGSFATLFKEFPYKKIGVRASLENDVFRINGTIREGGKEYIIKRGSFSGVDIVNQNPDNRASFKDMVKRIKRVTATSGGPVIK